MKTLGIIFLILLTLFFAPAIIGGLISLLASVGVLLLVGGVAFFVTFLIMGSVFFASVVGVGVVLIATASLWLPVLLVCLVAYWLINRTQSV
ncbi:MAG: hypothetical protein JJU10_02085 [Idiomarina sp.]|nr:hypothetical protein [Idiomarina sp.]